jgi:hypothetical protein
MRSIADSLRDDLRRRVADLTPEARTRLAFELGDADVIRLCDARGITPAEAKALIARSRHVGRRPSVANRG